MQDAPEPFQAVSRPVFVLDKTAPPEVTEFGQMLLQLPETGHSFYNSTRPSLYIPWQIELYTDKSDKVLRDIIYQWQDHPVAGKVCAVKLVDPNDFTPRALLTQFGNDLCTAQKLVVYVEKTLQSLVECLATLLSLSLAEELELHFHPHCEYSKEFELMLSVANLFCKTVHCVHYGGAKLSLWIIQDLQKYRRELFSVKKSKINDEVAKITGELVAILSEPELKFFALEDTRTRLFEIILIGALNQRPAFLSQLVEYCDNLYGSVSKDVLEHALELMTAPKNSEDNDEDYFAIMALTQVLCQIVDNPLCARFILSEQNNNELYCGLLKHFYRDYFTAISVHDASNQQANRLLRLFCFGETKQLAEAQQLVVIKNRLQVLLQITAPSCESVYKELVESYVELRDRNDNGLWQTAMSLFDVLKMPPRNNENDVQYRDRMASVIMLAGYYKLPLIKTDGIFSRYLHELAHVYRAYVTFFIRDAQVEAYAVKVIKQGAIDLLEKKSVAVVNDTLIKILANLTPSQIVALGKTLSLDEMRALLVYYGTVMVRSFDAFPLAQSAELKAVVTKADELIKGLVNNPVADKPPYYYDMLLGIVGDPLREENNTCPLLESIKDPNNRLIEFICEGIIAKQLNFSFARLTELPEDPMSLAKRYDASKARIELMTQAGFDSADYLVDDVPVNTPDRRQSLSVNLFSPK